MAISKIFYAVCITKYPSSGLFRLQPKEIDNRTYVRYNDYIATLGLSYGISVQRNKDDTILSGQFNNPF